MTYLLASSYLGRRVLPKGRIWIRADQNRKGRGKPSPYLPRLYLPFREDPATEVRGSKEVGLLRRSKKVGLTKTPCQISGRAFLVEDDSVKLAVFFFFGIVQFIRQIKIGIFVQVFDLDGFQIGIGIR